MIITEYPKKPGCHRYSLQVDGLDIGEIHDLGEVVFLMRNPATIVGDEGRKHPTRNYCCFHAAKWGYGTCTEVNLFSLRAGGKPQLLEASRLGCDLVGPENDRVIYEAVSKADLVVVAWGSTDNDVLQHRADEAWELIRPLGKDLRCLGKNGGGSPRLPRRYSPQVRRVEDLLPWP